MSDSPTRSGPRGLGDLIRADSPLGALARAASSRLDLADCIRKQLPADLAAAITTCNLRPDGTLVVTVASPEWAARLRFEADGILTGCRGSWPAAARVRFRVGTVPQERLQPRQRTP
ncbi:MAG: DciA family protein [Gammaproteobacteria bacterium]|nr:DciA family protein [Gammaproteobacteria bacterium]